VSTYKPNKRAHRILQRLDLGADTFAGLLDLFAFDNRAEVRPKLHAILTALRTDGFVDHGFGAYRITEAGRTSLALLDAGEIVREANATPTVRIFARREAA